ncbi:MAG: MlaD family protein [Deltaproteobacteria bacterium]|nr:MlaD family protein [Deltaproteobacteria bacterium]
MPITEKDPRFKGLEVKTGMLVLAAFAGVIAVLVLIGMERDLFTKKYRLNFVSPSGAGFVKGMPVKLSGFKIGRVRKIELTGDARVEIVAEINRKYERWIREGSKARLVKEGFIGDAFVEITGGEPEGRMLAGGDTLPFEKTGGIEALVEEAKPVLKEIKEIIDYANDPEGDIKVILGNMRELTGELKSSKSAITGTLKELSEAAMGAGALAGRLNERSGPIMESAGNVMKRLDGITERLDPMIMRLDGITGNVEDAARRLPAAAGKMEKIIDDVNGVTDIMFAERRRIRQILMDAEDAARDGRKVIKGLKESWPARLLVPEEQPPGLVPLDGGLFERRMDDQPSH